MMKYILLSFFFVANISFSQNKNELSNTSFFELAQEIKNNVTDSLKATNFIELYINKAKKVNDTLNIATGLYYKTLLGGNYRYRISVLDSIINLTKNTKGLSYPSIAFMDKGIIFYNRRQFSDALNNYLLADKYNHDKNEFLNYSLKFNIGSLKLRIDENKEALYLIEDCTNYIERNNIREKNPKQYLNHIIFLANAYRKNNLIEESINQVNLGYAESIKMQDEHYENSFRILKGILSLHNNQPDYNIALYDLTKGADYMKQTNFVPNLAFAYYYLGKTYELKRETSKSISYYKKVDSLFGINKNLSPELMDSYARLIEFYKKENNSSKELFYIKKIISLDSLYKSQYKYLINNIKVEYEIPKLLQKHDSIIEKIENKNKTNKHIFLLILSLIILVFLILFVYQRRFFTHKLYLFMEKNKKSKLIKKNKELPFEISNEIEMKLNFFEKSFDFLNEELTLSKLALMLGTNTNYLSKVINKRNRNFATYIKELRIEYAYEELRKNSKLRNYTIKAIASECGFKRSESFSKAFYKKYNMYPSNYIKQIKSDS